MQTNIIKQYLDTAKGREADRILRSCVHCGFCTATCPTYTVLGDELDGPRGRIYLIKQLLEGQEVTQKTQLHLDRCLTCRSCETTCPSGVQYARLIDIGRELTEKQVNRGFIDKLTRYSLRKIVPYPKRFASLVKIGRLLKPAMPAAVRSKIPALPQATAWPEKNHERRMLVLDGCAQSVASPNTNSSAAKILDGLGIELVAADNARCCGAVSHHLSAIDEALNFMRSNIDAWWPYVEQGVEAVVITASGCGSVVKEYGHLLQDDAAYAAKAKKISELCKDISEVLLAEDLSKLKISANSKKVAFHNPCTLQHGQRLNGAVESVFSNVGFELTEVKDAHLCCGSAGTYSILQKRISQQLLTNKLHALQRGGPEVIATANIGCQLHLAGKAEVPVMHWVELIEDAME